jgi:nucleoside-diphosphate-sugar epimerase
MKRVLVTGASGCIGRQALPILVERGWDVQGATTQAQPAHVDGVTWHRADLLNADETARLVQRTKPSHLLHLAWYIAPGKWAVATENLDWVQASLALLKGFRDAGGVRVVTAGSCLEYDWAYGYCSEARTPCSPHTLYGTCKHALRLLTQGLAASAHMSSAWGRIFFLYGPGEHPDRLVPSVIRSLLAGEIAQCSHGNQVRDYLHAEDIARAFVDLLESDVEGPINIASGNPVRLKEIVIQVGSIIGCPQLIQFGAIPQAATDTPLVVADISRLSTALGWTPKHNLESGLRQTIDWWRTTLAMDAQAAQRLGATAIR